MHLMNLFLSQRWLKGIYRQGINVIYFMLKVESLLHFNLYSENYNENN